MYFNVEIYNNNWRAFIEVFLDVDRIWIFVYVQRWNTAVHIVYVRWDATKGCWCKITQDMLE